jgi:hypothetical protein
MRDKLLMLAIVLLRQLSRRVAVPPDHPRITFDRFGCGVINPAKRMAPPRHPLFQVPTNVLGLSGN